MPKTINDLPNDFKQQTIIKIENGEMKQSRHLLNQGIKICDHCFKLNPFETLVCKYCETEILIICK